MTPSPYRVIDGGLATELARRGFDLTDDLWSARLLLDAPEAIEQVHEEYFLAGADVAIAASYQASYGGFAERGLTAEATTTLLRRAVEIAVAARGRVLEARPHLRRALLVAASVGPHGATQHDGSEYRGDDALDEDALVDFHRARFDVLAAAGADLLACETIPSLREARSLVRLLRAHPDARAWVTFSCRDGGHTAAGDSIGECARWLDRVPQVVGIGVNCVAPQFALPLIDKIAAATDKAIVVYPNSGETWDAVARCWVGVADRFTAYVPQWLAAGATWIGGCCRSTPDDIRQVRAQIDAFHDLRAHRETPVERC
ncbi:MAG: homocysteine S-methyltransferase [Gemmatimonadaceae bacterium]